VTVNNIQVILVCGRPGDRGGGTETPTGSCRFLYAKAQEKGLHIQETAWPDGWGIMRYAPPKSALPPLFLISPLRHKQRHHSLAHTEEAATAQTIDP